MAKDTSPPIQNRPHRRASGLDNRGFCPSETEIAKRAALAYIECNCDPQATALYLYPTHDQDEVWLAQVANRIAAPEGPVQKYLNEVLLKHWDLSDISKRDFVMLMWKWARGKEHADDAQFALTAARILGRGMIGDKVKTEEVETLRIEGLEEGLVKMGLTNEKGDLIVGDDKLLPMRGRKKPGAADEEE